MTKQLQTVTSKHTADLLADYLAETMQAGDVITIDRGIDLAPLTVKANGAGDFTITGYTYGVYQARIVNLSIVIIFPYRKYWNAAIKAGLLDFSKPEPVKPAQAKPEIMTALDYDLETVITFYVPDSNVETVSIFRNVDDGSYFSGLTGSKPLTAPVNDYSKAYLDVCDLFFPRIPEIYTCAWSPAPAPLDYFNDYQFPTYGLDRDLLDDLEPVNLDQIPYDFNAVYPIAYQETVKPEPSQLHFDWSPAYDSKPEPVNLSYAMPSRFDLVDLEPEPSTMDQLVLWIETLEEKLDLFGSPIVIAPMYLMIMLLVARVFFGL